MDPTFPVYDTDTIIRAIAIVLAVALALPALGRLKDAVVSRQGYGALALVFVLICVAAAIWWLNGARLDW